jgi:hypothetical protein
MKLTIVDDGFFQGGHPTYTRLTGFPEADPRLAGLILNHRVINGIFDDLTPGHDYFGEGVDEWAYPDTGIWDPERNTDSFVKAMPAWRDHGVIAFTVGLQGGNPFWISPPPEEVHIEDLDAGAFEPDGVLRPAFMARLKRILDRARELDMVPIVNYFYQHQVRRIREVALPAAVDNATNWLLDNGYDGLIVDLANECTDRSYYPALQPGGIHELIHRVRDDVDLHNARSGKERRFYIGASFGGWASTAVQIARVPESFFRAVDLLLPHGNQRTIEEVQRAVAAMRERSRGILGRTLPIVYNEDMANPQTASGVAVSGDLEHFHACVDAHVSWGNLIRSHQAVPCQAWIGGGEVQDAWFAATRALAGAPLPPHSVRKLYHRI